MARLRNRGLAGTVAFISGQSVHNHQQVTQGQLRESLRTLCWEKDARMSIFSYLLWVDTSISSSPYATE